MGAVFLVCLVREEPGPQVLSSQFLLPVLHLHLLPRALHQSPGSWPYGPFNFTLVGPEHGP